jgi:hypothetical protein
MASTDPWQCDRQQPPAANFTDLNPTEANLHYARNDKVLVKYLYCTLYSMYLLQLGFGKIREK